MMAASAMGFVVFWGVLGLVVGSFLGTLVIRLPERRPVLWSRSRCDHCDAALVPWQLLPILGFALQRGRCTRCGKPLTLFYIFIELAAAGVAMFAVFLTAGDALWFTLALGWLLLALGAMDARTLQLSTALILIMFLLGLAAGWVFNHEHFVDHLIGALAGFGSLYAAGLVYWHVRHRPGLGAGDAKLLGAAGAWVGWQGLPSVVLIAAVSALLLVVCQIAVGRAIKFDSRLPFGTYLCGGIWIVWLCGPVQW